MISPSRPRLLAGYAIFAILSLRISALALANEFDSGRLVQTTNIEEIDTDLALAHIALLDSRKRTWLLHPIRSAFPFSPPTVVYSTRDLDLHYSASSRFGSEYGRCRNGADVFALCLPSVTARPPPLPTKGPIDF